MNSFQLLQLKLQWGAIKRSAEWPENCDKWDSSGDCFRFCNPSQTFLVRFTPGQEWLLKGILFSVEAPLQLKSATDSKGGLAGAL